MILDVFLEGMTAHKFHLDAFSFWKKIEGITKQLNSKLLIFNSRFSDLEEA